MAARVVVVSNPVRTASRYTGKPRKLFRGVVRTLIRKTIQKLSAILSSDIRQANRGLVIGFVPARVLGTPDSLSYAAYVALIERLTNCMGMLEGQDV